MPPLCDSVAREASVQLISFTRQLYSSALSQIYQEAIFFDHVKSRSALITQYQATFTKLERLRE